MDNKTILNAVAGFRNIVEREIKKVVYTAPNYFYELKRPVEKLHRPDEPDVYLETVVALFVDKDERELFVRSHTDIDNCVDDYHIENYTLDELLEIVDAM